MLGNAVTVNLMKAIGDKIKIILEHWDETKEEI